MEELAYIEQVFKYFISKTKLNGKVCLQAFAVKFTYCFVSNVNIQNCMYVHVGMYVYLSDVLCMYVFCLSVCMYVCTCICGQMDGCMYVVCMLVYVNTGM